MSLRLKISLLSALISGAILLGFGGASWYVMYRERLAAVDREIRTLAARHPGWFANRANYQRLTSMLEFTFGDQRKDHVILLILDQGNTVLYRSRHWPEALELGGLGLRVREDPNALAVPEAAAPEPEVPRGGPPWGPGPGGGFGMGRGYGRGPGAFEVLTKAPRFVTARAGQAAWRLGILENDRTTVILGISFEEVRSDLDHLRNAFLMVLPMAFLLAGLGGWVVGSRALRPLKAIADTAERVTARGLDQRIPLKSGDREIARVVSVLNGMMDRLEKSFHQATRFTADASHELKTPLAIMQGELEHALQTAPTGSREQQVYNNLLEEAQRLKNITRNLLLLAQADSGQLKLSREAVGLSDLLENALEDARVLATEFELTFEVQVTPNLRVPGDPVLLSTAIHNLLGNAVKYNETHGRILLQAKADGNQVAILVGNSGPGIPPTDQSRIFERFYRARQSNSRPAAGLGLGLSLAREIVRAHGGDVSLQESRPGWTCFKIRLPAGSLTTGSS